MVEAGKQIIEMVHAIVEAKPKKFAEMAVGTLLESERIKMADKVRIQREPLFQAIGEGVASILDRSYAERTQWKPENREQQDLYNQAQQITMGLSKSEKLQLGLFLTQFDTSWETSFAYLNFTYEWRILCERCSKILSSRPTFSIRLIWRNKLLESLAYRKFSQ